MLVDDGIFIRRKTGKITIFVYRIFLTHPCNKSPSAIAVTIVAAIAVAIAVPRAAAIAGVRAYESVPLYAVPL